jgi:hypothetical protein
VSGLYLNLMKRKIIYGLIGLILVLIIIVKSSVSEVAQDTSVPINNQNILCYRPDKNTCTDYLGMHRETCIDDTTLNHWWCHENYCIHKDYSCLGGGTNMCQKETLTSSAKCYFNY